VALSAGDVGSLFSLLGIAQLHLPGFQLQFLFGWWAAVEPSALLLGFALDRDLDVNLFPDPTEAAQAKIFTSEMAIKVTNDALQLFGAAGYSRNRPLERMVRDARMFTIGGGTAQVLRTLVASRLLGWKLPQTRNGHIEATARPLAAE